ncbi:MAG TPA: DNA repair protein RecO [Rhodothermales bacterium]|nr:DNA repair protein RecO [Rhodothermales bacterium]
MILKSEAIVLRRMNYGETSQIITLFTRKKGKVSVLAKGARSLKSRFGATLEPLSYIQAVYYHKPTRDLQTLSETTRLYPLYDLIRNPAKTALAFQMVELVDAVSETEAINIPLFTLLLEALATLNDVTYHADNILFYFELRLAVLFGVAPHIKKTTVEEVGEEGGWFLLEQGSVLPAHIQIQGVAKRASRAALRALATLALAPLETLLRFALDPQTRNEVRQLIDAYLTHHFEGLHRSRTRDVLAQMDT